MPRRSPTSRSATACRRARSSGRTSNATRLAKAAASGRTSQPGYERAAGPYPLLLQFDGWGSRKLGLHTTLDNMIADGVIPPVVCVMMHNIDRMAELPCNAVFTDWLADDFLPAWREKYAITDDPARTVVTGMSLGGLASAFCGLRRPEVFGNVLSQSGLVLVGAGGHGRVAVADSAVRGVAAAAVALLHERRAAGGRQAREGPGIPVDGGGEPRAPRRAASRRATTWCTTSSTAATTT